MLFCRITVFLVFFIFPFFSLQSEPLKVSVAADSALLINADTGAILYEKKAHVSQYPASVTKIATALYALKKKGGNLDEIAIADQESIGSVTEEVKARSNYKIPAYRMVVGGSHIGLKRGEAMSLRDLLYGLLIASGDDAGNVIAHHISGSIPTFMDEVNLYLKEIGCQNTHFLNPHGLHHPDHKTTAHDMAIIARECLKDPIFCEMVSTVRYTRPKTNKQEATTWVSTNRLLRQGQFYYPKAIGVKTGHGSPALNTFVGAARHEGRTLILVLLHTKERSDIFADSIKLFQAAFDQKKVERTLVKAGPQKYALKLDGVGKPIATYVRDPLIVQYYPSEEPQFKAILAWEQLNLPITKDQRVGEIRILDNRGNLLQSVPLLAQEELSLSWMDKLRQLIF